MNIKGPNTLPMISTGTNAIPGNSPLSTTTSIPLDNAARQLGALTASGAQARLFGALPIAMMTSCGDAVEIVSDLAVYMADHPIEGGTMLVASALATYGLTTLLNRGWRRLRMRYTGELRKFVKSTRFHQAQDALAKLIEDENWPDVREAVLFASLHFKGEGCTIVRTTIVKHESDAMPSDIITRAACLEGDMESTLQAMGVLIKRGAWDDIVVVLNHADKYFPSAVNTVFTKLLLELGDYVPDWIIKETITKYQSTEMTVRAFKALLKRNDEALVQEVMAYADKHFNKDAIEALVEARDHHVESERLPGELEDALAGGTWDAAKDILTRADRRDDAGLCARLQQIVADRALADGIRTDVLQRAANMDSKLGATNDVIKRMIELGLWPEVRESLARIHKRFENPILDGILISAVIDHEVELFKMRGRRVVPTAVLKDAALILRDPRIFSFVFRLLLLREAVEEINEVVQARADELYGPMMRNAAGMSRTEVLRSFHVDSLDEPDDYFAMLGIERSSSVDHVALQAALSTRTVQYQRLAVLLQENDIPNPFADYEQRLQRAFDVLNDPLSRKQHLDELTDRNGTN